MHHLLRLIRWPNLLLVALTQFLVHHFVLKDAFRQISLQPALSTAQLLGLILATVCITAAGYIVNDLYDFKTDNINRPDKVIVERHISRSEAWWLYGLLTSIGFLPALWLAISVGPWYYLGLYPLGLLALLLYSSHLKRLGWPGNLLVSIFCAGVTAVVWLAEQSSWMELSKQQNHIAQALQKLLLLYLLFAFLSNLYREWIKDLQDFKGDRATQRLTLPVRLGKQHARRYTLFVGILFWCISLVFNGQLFLQHKTQAAIFFAAFISLPLTYSLLTLHRNHKQKHYQRHAKIAKFVMFAGVLLLSLL